MWPCPHALPSPALAAACEAFGGEPHLRNAPDCHTLPAPRGARVLPVGASVPTRAPPPGGGGGGHTRPMPGGGGGGGNQGGTQGRCSCSPARTIRGLWTMVQPFMGKGKRKEEGGGGWALVSNKIVSAAFKRRSNKSHR